MKSKKQVKVVIQPTRAKARKVKEQELTRLGSALRSLGALGGTAVGSYFGNPVGGSAVGTSLGAALSKWLGSGDYAIDQNSLVTHKLNMGNTIPDMHKNGQTIVVRHREFIATLNSATTFTVQNSFDINPGNATLFPWLSGVASRFQEYKIRGMVYHYIPTSGSAVASTNSALGAVMLQTSYRASDSAPTSKIEMLNEYNSNESVPCETFCHPIECDPKENPFNVQYVRTVDTPTTEDKLLYDLGTTHVAVQGCQTDGNPIGDLWVTYEIELKKPIVSSNIVSRVACYGARIVSPTSINAYFDGGTLTTNGTLPVTLSGTTLYFPRGRVGSYQITLMLVGSFTSWTYASSPTLTNCSLIQGFPGTNSLTTAKTGTTDTVSPPARVVWVQVTDPTNQASVNLTAPIVTGAITSTYVSVSIFNSTLG